ncbi:MAG: EamA family transporter [Bryobacteraceae bacterium]|nr:EamA family transporter [Bryobacteraceae bacterium]
MGSASLRKAYFALAAVCFFWGTTYLGIRVALESFPPATLVAARFLLSGAILLSVAKLKRSPLPSGRALWLTSFYGFLTLGIGNSALTVAELWIPSGLAALFITTSPFWMVGIEAALPGGERLYWPTVLAMIAGLGGAALLVGPGVLNEGLGSRLLHGFLVLQIGCAGWSTGSLLQRRTKTPSHPFVTAAVQQLAAGLAFVPIAFVTPHEPVRWSWQGVFALLYLVTFGSIVGYTAFVYALEHLPVALVSIYTYINPVVAVILGWLFYREPFGSREGAAMVIIFISVAAVKWTAGTRRRA